MRQKAQSTTEVLAGLVERVTFHNQENGFCVLRIKARGHRDLVTTVGHAAMISAGEWITASGAWTNDRNHGLQFKAWSYLDVIAERPNNSDWQADMRTFRLVLNDFEQLFFQDDIQILRPKKFRLNASNPANSGTSDHFPVAVDLRKRGNMNKHLKFSLCASAMLLATQVFAQDEGKLYIFKEAGEMPRVEASSVDALGASAIYEFLEEDFVVFHGSWDALSATSTEPVRPITVPGGNPILPICQCPEDYTAALTERFNRPEIRSLLDAQRVVSTPSSLPSLEPNQVEMLREMIRQNGPLLLQGQ